MRPLSESLERSQGHINFEDLVGAFHLLSTHRDNELWPFVTDLKEPFALMEKSDSELFESLHQIALGFLRSQLEVGEANMGAGSYLKKLVDMVRRSVQPTLATLNYDLTLETVMEAESIPYSTGFRRPEGLHAEFLPPSVEWWPFAHRREIATVAPWAIPEFWLTADGEQPDLRLLKLHGSLDWFHVERRPVYEPSGGIKLFPQDPIVRCRFLPKETMEETMIVGRLKRRLEDPFLILFSEFRREVLSTDVVVVLGYSFSDTHINEVLIDTQLSERFTSFDLIVVNGPNWPLESMSRDAKRHWQLLCHAGRQRYQWENLSEVQVIPYYAEEAINAGHLETAIAEVLTQRRFRRP